MPLSSKQKRFIRKNHKKISAGKLAKQLGASAKEVESYVKSLASEINPQHERIFRLITLALPFLFIFSLEIGLRLFHYGGNLSLFVSAQGDYADYYTCNPNVGRRYFVVQNAAPDPGNDLFLKKKSENGYRIFVLGGSTTAGYPYGNNIMFPRILQYRLADVFPEKHIEVINTAMTAVNSYTLLDFLDEIVEHEADAILIYAGHNEFYGALGAGSSESLGKFRGFVKFYLKLQKFKTFLLLRNGLAKFQNWLNRIVHEGDVNDPTATLMERMVSHQTIPYGSPIYEIGKRQFEGNLRDIIRKAKNAGVEVMVSQLVSNIRDIKPFVSVKTDSLPPAEEVYNSARQFEKEGKFKSAKQAYLRAKDLDALRFRATEEFNGIIQQVAAEFDTPVVPMKTYFENASPNTLIGNNIMLEHLHPNADGYFLMAEAFFDEMYRQRFVEAVWDSSRIKPASYYRENWGYTELDAAYADIRIRILKGNWPFKPKWAVNRALLDYHPGTRAESLAVSIWSDKDKSLEQSHVELAEYYEKKRRYEKAFEEYRALIHLTPFNVSPYLRAAKMLIERKQFDRALPFLHASLKYEDTAYANKWLGQIYLEAGQVKEALPFLEKATKKAPKDPQLIYNLSGAYALNHQYNEAKATLKRLEELRPNFPGAADLKRQLEKL
jgi:tetratricopeptide (TPR) repeat protein